MREKLVNQLNGGEVLADSVITGDNQVIVPKGTVLKEEYIGLMGILGINSVWIQDYYDTIEQKNEILTEGQEKDFYNKIKFILERYIYKEQETLNQVRPLAIEIVDSVRKNMKKKSTYDFEPYQADLYKHTLRVTLFSIMLGICVDMKINRLYDLATGALLHDLGIRFISTDYYDFDMNKKLPSEILELKKHTILGYTVLENEAWISDVVKKMVLSHHEKSDGSGYPLKQKNQEIECKIIQLCDSFDGMLCGMECVKTNVELAFSEIETNIQEYDKKLVKIFMNTIATYPVGTKVKLKNGKEAIVVKQAKIPNQPVVYVLDSKCSSIEEIENTVVKMDL